jgi:hypothetical protein
MTRLRKFHLALGVLGFAAFLLSGAYMKLIAHPSQLPDRGHLMFLSRHIYCLANALVHMSLAAYVTPFPTRAAGRAQWIGSVMLGISGLLLMSAFVVEGIGERSRTMVSTYGLYLLLAGVLFHFVPAVGSEARRNPKRSES